MVCGNFILHEGQLCELFFYQLSHFILQSKVRLGGDEFLIVFNGIDISAAENIWKRIIEAYDKINTVEQRAYNISVSHGIVDFDNKQKTNVDDLINTADEKMYQEKQVIKKNLQVVR